MRILVVSHPPLEPKLGAAQTAMALADALRRRGHDTVLWSPAPLPRSVRGLAVAGEQERRLLAFLADAQPFDVIDSPASTLSQAVGRHGFLVARSVQPEVLYRREELRAAVRHLSPRALARLVQGWRVRRRFEEGWRCANAILSLGTLEREWMTARYPEWRAKMGHYLIAPPPGSRKQFLEVRARRAGQDRDAPILWLGRWTTHKGAPTLRRLLRTDPRLKGRRLTLAGCGTLHRHTLPGRWVDSGRVEVIPDFTREELPELLARHDLGLFTSTVEGWGLSLSEMLESGITVYATHAGAVPDLQSYFPATLRELSGREPFAVAAPEDLETNGYLAFVSWPAIAERYEQEVLSRVR